MSSAHLFRRVLQRLRSEEQRGLAQDQREALLDLLVWTMFADHHIAAPEQALLQREAQDLEWEGVRSLELYIDASVRRVRDVLECASSEEAYLTDIAARLGTQEARRKALQAARTLAHVDGELAPREAELLERIRTQFGLH